MIQVNSRTASLQFIYLACICFKYNRFNWVELFFNLVWSVLSLILGFLWIRGLRESRKNPARPRAIYQLIALSMLILILLPVVSLTDDLHTMAGPVESEHITRRVNYFPGTDQPADIASLLHAQLFVSRFLPQLRSSTPAVQSTPIIYIRPGFTRQAANRPPPLIFG